MIIIAFTSSEKQLVRKVKKIYQDTVFGIIMHISCYKNSSGNQSSCPLKIKLAFP